MSQHASTISVLKQIFIQFKMSLPTAPLGRNGPQVNRLGFGLMGLSTAYGPLKPDSERLALLDHAYELGERFWDTSDM